jgi:hypothetical protein
MLAISVTTCPALIDTAFKDSTVTGAASLEKSPTISDKTRLRWLALFARSRTVRKAPGESPGASFFGNILSAKDT